MLSYIDSTKLYTVIIQIQLKLFVFSRKSQEFKFMVMIWAGENLHISDAILQSSNCKMSTFQEMIKMLLLNQGCH